MSTAQWWLICWGLVIIVWWVGGLYDFFLGPKTLTPNLTRQRTTVLLLGIVAMYFFWRLLRQLPENFWGSITLQADWLWFLGLALLLSSTVFVLWARWVLGKFWSSYATIKQDHQLHTDGPYRVTRHPIYTGFLGMTIGTMLMNGFGFMLPVLAVALIFFFTKIRSEEILLTQTFGEQYAEYKRRVPQLIPGLLFKRPQ